MNDILKQRLVGALILLALGVVFWPIIFVEPGDTGPEERASIPPRPVVDTTPVEAPDMAGLTVAPETRAERERDAGEAPAGDAAPARAGRPTQDASGAPPETAAPEPVAAVEAAIVEIQSLLSLPSGYQRDLQLTKAPLIRGLAAALQALAIVPALVEGLGFREDAMREAISVEMYATDLALEKAARGVPFRAAYLDAKQKLDAMQGADAAASLAQRVSPGGCGNLLLERIRGRLEQEISSIPGT